MTYSLSPSGVPPHEQANIRTEDGAGDNRSGDDADFATIGHRGFATCKWALFRLAAVIAASITNVPRLPLSPARQSNSLRRCQRTCRSACPGEDAQTRFQVNADRASGRRPEPRSIAPRNCARSSNPSVPSCRHLAECRALLGPCRGEPETYARGRSKDWRLHLFPESIPVRPGGCGSSRFQIHNLRYTSSEADDRATPARPVPAVAACRQPLQKINASSHLCRSHGPPMLQRPRLQLL